MQLLQNYCKKLLQDLARECINIDKLLQDMFGSRKNFAIVGCFVLQTEKSTLKKLYILGAVPFLAVPYLLLLFKFFAEKFRL